MVYSLLVLILATVLYGGAMAQSDCSGAMTSLYPCLGYLSGGSSLPTSYCCRNFFAVVQYSPECLCMVVNSDENSFSGFSFNRTLALGLPIACNVQTPPASRCKAGSNGPTIPPTSSPVNSQAPQSAISPPGSKTFPWSTNESSTKTNVITLSLVSIALVILAQI